MKKRFKVLLEYTTYNDYKYFDTLNEAMWFIINEGDHLIDHEIFDNGIK